MDIKLSFGFGVAVNKRDVFFESIIINCNRYKDYFASKAVEYCIKVLKKPWPKAEKLIVNSPMAAYKYSRFVLKNRWPRAEAAISKHSMAAYLYARFVLKGRFKKGERSISSWNRDAFLYSKYILKGKFPAAEKSLMSSGFCADYAVGSLKKRWKKAEDGILVNTSLESLNRYIEMLRGKDRIDFHNKIIALGIGYSEDVPSWRKPTWKRWLEKHGEDFVREKP